MKNNLLGKLSNSLRKSNIQFFLSGDQAKIKNPPKIVLPDPQNSLRYFKENPYPSGLLENLDLHIKKSNLDETKQILNELGFAKISSSSNRISYFIYDPIIGLLNLLLISHKELPKENDVPTLTSRPKMRRFLNGKVICFVAPEGGGKTSTTSSVFTVLQNFPTKKHHDTFSSFKHSKLYRIFDLTRKLLALYKIKLTGDIIVLDRYIYLTFRKNKFLRRLLFILAPTPDMTFIMNAPYPVLKKRRGPLCKPKSEVDLVYSLFGEAKNKTIVNSQKPISENLNLVINKILSLY